MYLDSEKAEGRLKALSELEKRLSFRISRLSRLLDNHASKLLSDSSLNLTSYRILMVLSIFKETSAADLARLMVVDRAQISRSLSDLDAKDFVSDRPDPKSKRRKLLSLTEKGRIALSSMQPKLKIRQRAFEKIFTPEELSIFNKSIDKLSRYFANEIDYPEAIPSSEVDRIAD